MKKFAIAALALVAACSQPAEETTTAEAQELALVDRAGNRIEQLTARESAQCTSDGAWCVEITGPEAIVRRGGEQAAAIPLEGEGSRGVWPSLIITNGTALVGLTRTAEQMYSGGGGRAMEVTLYDVSGAAPVAVLTAPLSGEIMIRACFDEDDAERRRQACHDEYDFAGTLGLDGSVREGAPRFVLSTEATSYPGARSRNGDSTQEQALREADLQRVRDETCSYRRVATRRGDAYVWDTPLPACANYLEP